MPEIKSCTNLDKKVLDELIEVWDASVRSTHFFLSEDDIAKLKPLIYNQYFKAVNLFVIYEEDETISAFLGLSDTMVEMLFVHPKQQGKGYGTALLNFAYEKKGIKLIDVNEDNQKGLNFYLSRGYKIIGRDAIDPQGNPFPILHLKKD